LAPADESKGLDSITKYKILPGSALGADKEQYIVVVKIEYYGLKKRDGS